MILSNKAGGYTYAKKIAHSLQLILSLILFQGKELWEVSSTNENQNGGLKVINLELEKIETGQEIGEENIVQLKDDEGKVFLVSQKYLEPLLQES